MFDVFLSYARDEAGQADLVRQALAEIGLKIFVDTEGGISAGDSFPSRIVDGIENSRIVLALWSPHALTREWVRREALLAKETGKLLPALIQPTSPTQLREFIDLSVEDLVGFSPEMQHLGWSRILMQIGRKLDAWAEENSQHPEAVRCVDLAAAVKHQGIKSKPPSTIKNNVAQVGIQSAWASVDKTKENDVLNFAESYPGTNEAFVARRLAEQLKEQQTTLGELKNSRSAAINAQREHKVFGLIGTVSGLLSLWVASTTYDSGGGIAILGVIMFLPYGLIRLFLMRTKKETISKIDSKIRTVQNTNIYSTP